MSYITRDMQIVSLQLSLETNVFFIGNMTDGKKSLGKARKRIKLDSVVAGKCHQNTACRFS